MDNLRLIIFSLIAVAVVVFGVYWSFNTIETGADHVYNQEKEDLKKENKDLRKQVEDLQDQIAKYQEEEVNTQEELVNNEEPEVVKETEPVKPTTVVIFKYQSLIDSLQKMVNDKITLKRGSQGTRVGTIQQFLNIYNKTSNKIDNDYGATTETAVKNFQKAQGLTVDGQAGPGVFREMIDWLKKQ